MNKREILDEINKIKEQGSVCCLDESFLDVAIKEIGEGRLERYLRGE